MKYLGKNEKGQMRLSRRAVLMRDNGSDTNSTNVINNNKKDIIPPPTKISLSASAEASY